MHTGNSRGLPPQPHATGRIAIMLRWQGVVMGVLAALACSAPPPPPPPPDAQPEQPADDVFVRAVDNWRGGALLAVWLPPRRKVWPDATRPEMFRHYAYLAGGYEGVDPGALPPGERPGRLVGYDGAGRFTTLCQLDRVARAVYGEAGVVYVAGDGGLVTRYDPVSGRCDPLQAQGHPAPNGVRFRAIAGANASPPEIYFAGESSEADSGRAALYRYDGQRFERVALPPEASGHGLRSISHHRDIGFWAVGDGAVAIRRPARMMQWQFEPPSSVAPGITLAAVSTESVSASVWTMAVGGDREAVVLARRFSDTAWRVRRISPPAARLLGVYSRAEWEVYMVGTDGTTLVFNAVDYYAPPRRLTMQPLFAVAGEGGSVLAVGGDVSNTTPTQSAVILVRGDELRTEYFVDGVAHRAEGRPRLDFGGAASQ